MRRGTFFVRWLMSVAITTGGTLVLASAFMFPSDFPRVIAMALFSVSFWTVVLLAWRRANAAARWIGLGVLAGLAILLWFGGQIGRLWELLRDYTRFVSAYNAYAPVYDPWAISVTYWLGCFYGSVLCAVFALRRVTYSALLAVFLVLAAIPFMIVDDAQYQPGIMLIFAGLLVLGILRVPERFEIADARPYLRVGLPVCAAIVMLAMIVPAPSGGARLPDLKWFSNISFSNAWLSDSWFGRFFHGSGSGGYSVDTDGYVRLGGNRALTNEPLFSVRAGKPLYLYTSRYSTYQSDYDGASWRMYGYAPAPEPPALEYLNLTVVPMSFVLNKIKTDRLILPAWLLKIETPDSYYVDSMGLPISYGYNEKGFEYTATAVLPDYGRIREAAMLYSVSQFAEYSDFRDDLSVSTTERVRELAESIYYNLPYEKQNYFDYVVAVQDYLSRDGGYTYTLTPDEQVGQDFADSFLFETKNGYCTYYATAMVVLLRSVGIPARYCEGFVMQHPSGGVYTVTPADAHAWPEVYIPGAECWLAFEPTGGSYADPMRPVIPSPTPSPTERPSPTMRPSPSPRVSPTPRPSPSAAPSKSPTARPSGGGTKPGIRIDPIVFAVALPPLGIFALFAIMRLMRVSRAKSIRRASRVTAARYWLKRSVKALSVNGLRPRGDETVREFFARAGCAGTLPKLAELSDIVFYSKGGIPAHTDMSVLEAEYFALCKNRGISKIKRFVHKYITGKIL